jgi:hypothetical protein
VCEEVEKSEGEANIVSSVSKKRKDILNNIVSSVSNEEGVAGETAEILKDPLPPTDNTDSSSNELGADL